MTAPNSPPNGYQPWLHRFAWLTAVAALALISLGGLVTSHGVGMAVQDWPTTFGYNMFFFPISQWVGGVYWEHIHRLAASAVGLLTSVLALWLYGRSARPVMRWLGGVLFALGVGTWMAMPRRWSDAVVLAGVGAALAGASVFWPRCEPGAKWLRRLGLAAFFAVVLQGILGGLRVVLIKDQIGIFHAALAQLFFVLLCAIGFLTGRKSYRAVLDGAGVGAGPNDRIDAEDNSPSPLPSPSGRGRNSDRAGSRAGHRFAGAAAGGELKLLLLGTTLLIFCQLVLGATMRHQHAGLAIPDFPTAYGKLWPSTDPASIALYNQHRMEVVSLNPITATQVILQMVHRILAGIILCAIAASAWFARRSFGARNPLSRLTLIWLVLVATQVFLGAATIWSDKAADIATGHVVVGALLLAVGSISSIVCVQGEVLAKRGVAASPVVGSKVAVEEKLDGCAPATVRL